MTKKIFYEKVGRRYKPVYEYDQMLLDGFPKGNHLVMCYPGGQSRRYNIDPNYAALIAAGRVAEDAMSQAVRKASELRPQRTLVTEGQRKAWNKLAKELGDDLATLNISSARDIADAGIKALYDEAKTLLTNEASKKAFEHFLLIATLSKEQKDDKG